MIVFLWVLSVLGIIQSCLFCLHTFDVAQWKRCFCTVGKAGSFIVVTVHLPNTLQSLFYPSPDQTASASIGLHLPSRRIPVQFCWVPLMLYCSGAVIFSLPLRLLTGPIRLLSLQHQHAIWIRTSNGVLPFFIGWMLDDIPIGLLLPFALGSAFSYLDL